MNEKVRSWLFVILAFLAFGIASVTNSNLGTNDTHSQSLTTLEDIAGMAGFISLWFAMFFGWKQVKKNEAWKKQLFAHRMQPDSSVINLEKILRHALQAFAGGIILMLILRLLGLIPASLFLRSRA